MKIIKNQEQFDELIIDNIFKLDDDVTFKFNLVTTANIDAWNIKAGDIDAWNIKAGNIDAGDIIIHK